MDNIYLMYNNIYYIKLTASKRVCVSKFKGSVMISLREYFNKDG